MQDLSANLLLYVFAGLAAAVLLIIGLAYLATRKPGDTLRGSLGLSPLTILLLVVWALSLLGLGRTGFVEPTLATWRKAVGLRVAFQLGCWAALALAFYLESRTGDVDLKPLAIVAAVLLVPTAIWCVNPVRQLAQGPTTRRGHLAVTLIQGATKRGYGGTRYPALMLTPTEGAPALVELPNGYRDALRAEVARSPDQLWDVTILDRMDWFIDARHSPAPRTP